MTKSLQPLLPSATKSRSRLILDNAVVLFLLGTEFMKKPWLLSQCQKLNQAVINFKRYMTDEYEAGNAGLATGKLMENNLMTQLVRAKLGQDGLPEAEI